MSQNTINIVGKHDLINVKNFENIDQFNDFYKLHEEEINKLSTVKLNKMYHIKNFKIVRRKIEGKEDSEGVKKLCFQQIYKTDSINDNDSRLTELEQTITELNNKIKALELANEKIINQLTEIINVINNSN